MEIDFAEPDSIHDAYERRRILVGEIEEIQAQLGDKSKKSDAFYEDWDAWRAYHVWRKGALWALTSRLQELRILKKWIIENRHTYKESEPIT